MKRVISKIRAAAQLRSIALATKQNSCLLFKEKSVVILAAAARAHMLMSIIYIFTAEIVDRL